MIVECNNSTILYTGFAPINMTRTGKIPVLNCQHIAIQDRFQIFDQYLVGIELIIPCRPFLFLLLVLTHNFIFKQQVNYNTLFYS